MGRSPSWRRFVEINLVQDPLSFQEQALALLVQRRCLGSKKISFQRFCAGELRGFLRFAMAESPMCCEHARLQRALLSIRESRSVKGCRREA